MCEYASMNSTEISLDNCTIRVFQENQKEKRSMGSVWLAGPHDK